MDRVGATNNTCVQASKAIGSSQEVCPACCVVDQHSLKRVLLESAKLAPVHTEVHRFSGLTDTSSSSTSLSAHRHHGTRWPGLVWEQGYARLDGSGAPHWGTHLSHLGVPHGPPSHQRPLAFKTHRNSHSLRRGRFSTDPCTVIVRGSARCMLPPPIRSAIPTPTSHPLSSYLVFS